MLFLFFIIIFQLWPENIKAQKFRMDYMWATTFETFYRLHDLESSWDQARQICEAEGTALLIPDNLDEMENLKLLMSNMRAHYTAIFIGLHDKFAEGDFVTLTGDPIAGTVLDLLWAPGTPDNINGNEHCVVMTREGLLDDRACSNIHPFVCKILGNNTKYNYDCPGYDLGYTPQTTSKCYKFHEEPLTWHDAYLICNLEEANLVIINTEEEAVLVSRLMSKYLQNKAPNPNILFLGFSDLTFIYEYRTIKGQTLEEAGYATWGPFTDNITEMESKRCGAIARTGELLMSYCDLPAMYICEKNADNSSNAKP